MPSLDMSLSPFSAPPATDIYTLSLHDALPIYDITFGTDAEKLGLDGIEVEFRREGRLENGIERFDQAFDAILDRKSTRLNSSHVAISYAVFCLKKKKKARQTKLACKPPLAGMR